jgi:hypothetical protein
VRRASWRGPAGGSPVRVGGRQNWEATVSNGTPECVDLVEHLTRLKLDFPFQARRAMGKGSEKHRSTAKKNKLRKKAAKWIDEGKKLRGKLLRFDPRHRRAA